MVITFTSSKVDEKQSRELNEFLNEFLPKYKLQPGILAIYHFNRPDKGDDVTITIWENQAAVQAYRQSNLIKEPMSFEATHNLPATREGYELIYATSKQI